MITTALTSFRNWTKERLGNPLLRAYVGFLLLFNWRILAIVFTGDGSIRERMELIRAYSYNPWVAYLVPLSLAIAYVLGMPYLLQWLYKWQSKPIQDQKQARMQAELDLAETRLKITQAEVNRNSTRDNATLSLRDRESTIEQNRLNFQHHREIEKLEAQERIKNQSLDAENRQLKLQVSDLESKVNNFENERRDLQQRSMNENYEVSRARDEALLQLNELKSDDARMKATETELRRQLKRLEDKVDRLEGEVKEAERRANLAQLELKHEQQAKRSGRKQDG